MRAAARGLAPARLAALGGALLLVALPRLLSGPLATEFLSWALFGLSFNVLLGYAGLLSFGHALFFAMGAYAVGLSMLHLALPLPAALALALAAAAAAALAVGALSIR